MKRLITSLMFAAVAFAQSPLIKYGPISVTGGTTLVDSSGNANNGTLHGTTVNAASITCNGSSDYVAIPEVISNSDFTVLAVASTSTNPGNNGLWSEGNTGATNTLLMDAGGHARIIGTGGSGGSNWSFANFPNYLGDYHLFYLQRSGANGLYGVFDQNFRYPQNIGSTTVTTTLGALCARARTTPDFFWPGTFAWVEVYNTALTPTFIASRYAAIRTSLASSNIFLRDIVTPLYPSRVWNRMGTQIVSAGGAEGANIDGEATVLHTTTDCALVANPCFQMVYDAGTTEGPWYAESPNGLPPWTKGGAISSIGTGYKGSSWAHVGSTYYYYGSTSASNIDCYTSSSPNTGYTLALASCIPKGAGGSWDATIWNTSIINVDATHWYGIYDACGTNCITGGVTSSDGIHWTKVSANPISGFGEVCNAPFLAYVNSTFYAWCGPNSTWITRWQSSIFNSFWQSSSPSLGPLSTATASGSLPSFMGNGSDESSQVVDWTMIEYNGQVYAYYTAQAEGHFEIKLAIANMTMAQLVLTGEGAASDQP